MDKYKVKVNPRAIHELDHIYEYIANEKLAPENAKGQIDRIKKSILSLDTFPQSHRRHRTDRKRMAVTPDGREAVTHWQVVDVQNGHSHITCRLETGRTHQIRVHMAYLGHPLLGDTVYGSKKPMPGLAGQCLHAARLTFTQPTTGERVEVGAPLPEWFESVLKRYGLE